MVDELIKSQELETSVDAHQSQPGSPKHEREPRTAAKSMTRGMWWESAKETQLISFRRRNSCSRHPINYTLSKHFKLYMSWGICSSPTRKGTWCSCFTHPDQSQTFLESFFWGQKSPEDPRQSQWATRICQRCFAPTSRSAFLAHLTGAHVPLSISQFSALHLGFPLHSPAFLDHPLYITLLSTSLVNLLYHHEFLIIHKFH